MFDSDFFPIVLKAFPDVTAPAVPEKFVRDPAAELRVPPATLARLCRFLKETDSLRFDLPLQATAVDYIKDGEFELVYCLYSTRLKRGVVLKSRVPRDKPEIDSIAHIWSGMDWQEREIYDLMGITFRGHANLKRIMMWDGFPGHPLRKDYVHVTDNYDSGLEIGTPGLDERGVPIVNAEP